MWTIDPAEFFRPGVDVDEVSEAAFGMSNSV